MGGKVGFLPDISKKFNYFMDLANRNLEYFNYNLAGSYLFNVNSCLPEDYIITIDDKAYNQLTLESKFYECGNCKTEIEEVINEGEEDERRKKRKIPTRIPLNEIKIIDYHLTSFDSFVTGNKTIKVFYCPKCDEVNPIIGANIVRLELAKPFFSRVYYSQPKRGLGISTRQIFPIVYKKWHFGLVDNLNRTMVDYRMEYKSIMGNEMEEPLYQQKEEVIA